jgi:hypothetical protein
VSGTLEMEQNIGTRLTSRQAALFDLVAEALSTFTSPHARSLRGRTYDAGPAVLVALASAAGHLDLDEVAGAALAAWLDRCEGTSNYAGLFGGLTGLFVGVHSASTFCPRLIPLAGQLRDTLAAWATSGLWRTEEIEWQDYDLISGPSGMILALTADPTCIPECILPAARHLALLCDRDDMDRLRIHAYSGDEQRGWNCGRINTGLAHGVGGVVAALRSACETDESIYEELRTPLRRACRWFVRESYVDDRGLRTWHPAALEGAPRPSGASRRQAWCYGTPGLAWTLWEAGRVLDDVSLRAFAEEAMRSFCAAFDEQLYIDDGPADDALGICHGAAGTLAIADAFALHCGHLEAKTLAEQLEAYLLRRLDDIRQLANENMTLLSGASGILAVLLIRCGVSQRDWLSQIALR